MIVDPWLEALVHVLNFLFHIWDLELFRLNNGQKAGNGWNQVNDTHLEAASDFLASHHLMIAAPEAPLKKKHSCTRTLLMQFPAIGIRADKLSIHSQPRRATTAIIASRAAGFALA